MRFEGDEEKAGAPYEGVNTAHPRRLAGCVRWAVSLPPHVSVDRLEVRPVRQGAVVLFARDE